MADIDRRQLPSVEDAKAKQLVRAQLVPEPSPTLAPAAESRIGEYQAARKDASAAVRTRPMVAPSPGQRPSRRQDDTFAAGGEKFSAAELSPRRAVEIAEDRRRLN